MTDGPDTCLPEPADQQAILPVHTGPEGWQVSKRRATALGPTQPPAIGFPPHQAIPQPVLLRQRTRNPRGTEASRRHPPLPAPTSLRKPASSGSLGNPDSARKRQAFQRMFQRKLRGAWAFRRLLRSVSAPESRSANPRSCFQLGGRGVSRPCNCRRLLFFPVYWLPVFLEEANQSFCISGKGVKQT
ncbi:uncharacterized protein LOC116418397 [Piliocolobus tephrosceles]|uniref:uncharacterized protein LOC116418397 n=1 Tax=Piliocolobus tephrosceles TaxID=591936 RepID=UPI000E6B21A2|nr:uncharacterized protein LOC116418397 [Piliocolobus tephrosceles]